MWRRRARCKNNSHSLPFRLRSLISFWTANPFADDCPYESSSFIIHSTSSSHHIRDLWKSGSQHLAFDALCVVLTDTHSLMSSNLKICKNALLQFSFCRNKSTNSKVFFLLLILLLLLLLMPELFNCSLICSLQLKRTQKCKISLATGWNCIKSEFGAIYIIIRERKHCLFRNDLNIC